MAKASACACGADLTKQRAYSYFDDANYAISKSAPNQCLPCYADRHMRRTEAHDYLYSADAIAVIASDQGRFPRSRYVIVSSPAGVDLYA